jgi:hypothetical protein
MEIAHQKEPQATFHPLGIAFASQLELIPAHDCVLRSLTKWSETFLLSLCFLSAPSAAEKL